MIDYRMKLLSEHLRDFISGKDRSKEFVAKIEGILLEYFRDSEVYEELGVPVASYEPGGGEYMYDERDLLKEFEYALRRLREEGP